MKKHWYKYVHYGCAVCGGEWKRERVYGEKPGDVAERYEADMNPLAYCGCLNHLFY